MKYFTPELYIQFNSADEKEADRAFDLWEKAIEKYQNAVQANRGLFSTGIKEFLEHYNLHDGRLVRKDTSTVESIWRQFPNSLMESVYSISLIQNGNVVVLNYILSGDVRTVEPDGNWPFPKSKGGWLYDEIHKEDRAEIGHMWSHHILLSDGTELIVPFLDMFIQKISAKEIEGDLVGAGSQKGEK